MRGKLVQFLYLLVAGMSLVGSVWAADTKVAVISVTTKPYSELAYFPESSAPAAVVSLHDAVLSAQIQTSVESIPVKVAERVNQGEELISLDCRNARAMASAKQAALELAQYQFNRANKLRKKDHVSEEVLRQRTNELAAARAALKISQVDVERCTIKAPFNGVVQQRFISVGEWVSPGTALIRVVDLDEVEVHAEVSAINSNSLIAASDYDFMLGNQRYPLNKRAISAVTETSTRTRTIRLTFTDSKVAPGESGRLLWREAKRYLPTDYLEKRNGVYGVMVVDDNKARFVATPAAQEGRPIPVVLKDDVEIIVKGRQSVKDGDTVKVIR